MKTIYHLIVSTAISLGYISTGMGDPLWLLLLGSLGFIVDIDHVFIHALYYGYNTTFKRIKGFNLKLALKELDEIQFFSMHPKYSFLASPSIIHTIFIMIIVLGFANIILPFNYSIFIFLQLSVHWTMDILYSVLRYRKVTKYSIN